MWFFKPKTKKYRITFDVTCNGTIQTEVELPVKSDKLLSAHIKIGEILADLERNNNGIEFECDKNSLKIEEIKE